MPDEQARSPALDMASTIVISVCALVLVVALIVACIVCLRHRQRTKNDDDGDGDVLKTREAPSASVATRELIEMESEIEVS